MKKPTPETIWKSLNDIEIPQMVQEKLTEYANSAHTKHVISLGGGGAKALTGSFALFYLLEKLHLLTQFEEIWGSSASQIIGAAYSTGMNSREILEFMVNLNIRKYLQLSFSAIIHNRGLIKTTKIHKLLSEIYPVHTFEECKIPFFVVACSYTGESEHVEIFNKGSLADAITATICFPFVFQAFNLNGKKYVDGGLIENTPSLSVHQHHTETNDSRALAIFSTSYGEHHFNPTKGFITGKMMNILDNTRYLLQCQQIDTLRKIPNTKQLVLELDLPIGVFDFKHISTNIVNTYQIFLNLIIKVCERDDWNETYFKNG